MHACGGARNRRQEGDVLIVSVLIAIVVNLALHSNAQGCIEVGCVNKSFLVGLSALPEPAVREEGFPRVICVCRHPTVRHREMKTP